MNIQLNSMSPDYNYIKYLYQHERQDQVANSYLSSPAQQQYHSPRPNNSFQQANGISALSDAMISDDLLNSPANLLMCNPTNSVYNDQMMDTLNGM